MELTEGRVIIKEIKFRAQSMGVYAVPWDPGSGTELAIASSCELPMTVARFMQYIA